MEVYFIRNMINYLINVYINNWKREIIKKIEVKNLSRKQGMRGTVSSAGET